ncbi:MAG: PHP domain-containing protein, partial [Thalassococcus sp.]|uniref:PHP domain-containing protein n=1 Tax=Thalassococcus sp. TaxID=1928858 RepID=UPI001B16328C
MFAELSITSNFTFLTGASHPEEYMERAALTGLSAIAIADENSVAGIVRAWTKARDIARQVKERTQAEALDGPIGPPAPDGHIPQGIDITNVPRLIPAARLVFREGVEITALAASRTGWAHLCRLI